MKTLIATVALATTPIIITTAGQAGRAQKAEAFEAGAWDYMAKPVDPDELLGMIRASLASRVKR